MTNSISIYIRISLLLHLFICSWSSPLFALPVSSKHVPQDSFLVLSVRASNLVEKSGFLQSRTWSPMLQNFALNNPELHELLIDVNASGLNFKIPLQFFARIEHRSIPTPVFGVIAMVSDMERIDQKIRSFADSHGLPSKSSKFIRFGGENSPYELGRKGRIFYVMGIIPPSKNQSSGYVDLIMDQLHESFFSKPNPLTMPESLALHFGQTSDLSLYLDGTGFAQTIDNLIPDLENFWLGALQPLIDKFIHRSIGLHAHSSLGNIKLSVIDYSSQTKSNPAKVPALPLLDAIPGDLPMVARLSIPGNDFRMMIGELLDHFLRSLSNGRIKKESILPGFETSTAELLQFPSGDFVLAGGSFQPRLILSSGNEQSQNIEFNPSLAWGMSISDAFQLKQLFAGLNSANSLNTLLDSNDLIISEDQESLWFTTPGLYREINANRPIVPLAAKRRRLLEEHFFALDLQIPPATKSLRKSNFLSFEQLKSLNVIDDFSSFSSFFLEGRLENNLKLRDSRIHGWNIIFEHLGHELLERRNEELFQAIAQQDFNALVEAVSKGALINANDRFGHSPLHYAAYKGNARFVDYLLRNGGDPNARGRHDSTPLHSAIWGRNMECAEILLEDGADVDASTDEGETPGMTAALRGEKDLLEILFALSADPHAKDAHGTNLLDLAAAGGHREIAELLTEIGVDNQNPFHVAAGLGDLKLVKRLLKEGYEINQPDSFGATPLLIAMVAGQEEMVDFLLARNANPTLTAKDGYTLMHGAAFSGKKSMVRKALSLGLKVNSRYGEDGITPADVAEDEGDALPYLRAMGGRTAWELGPHH